MVISNLIIIANTVTLSLDKYPEDPHMTQILEQMNFAFTIFFALEMLLMIIGHGILNYARDSLNLFDGFIVIITLIEPIIQTTQGVSAFTAFRAFRLFRILKLARSWLSLRILLLTIGATFFQIGYFSVLLLIFMLVSALLGMEFFAYKIRPSPRLNFDTFGEAMISIFVLLTNENWNSLAYETMHGMDSYLPSIFFVITIIIGNFILLKLFIALLIYNFSM